MSWLIRLRALAGTARLVNKTAAVVLYLCASNLGAFGKDPAAPVSILKDPRYEGVGDFGGLDMYPGRVPMSGIVESQFDPERLNHRGIPPGPGTSLPQDENWDGKIWLLENELMATPTDDAARRNLVEALMRYGKYFDCAKNYDAGLHQYKRARFVDPSKLMRPIGGVETGVYPQLSERISESEVKAMIALETDRLFDCPIDAECRRHLAECYVKYGDLLAKRDRAVQANRQYRSALFIDKNCGKAFAKVGSELMFGSKSNTLSKSPLPP